MSEWFARSCKRLQGRASTVAVATLAAVASTTVLASAGGDDDDGAPGPNLGTLGVPTLILYDGKISTVDRRNSTVEAIALRDGEIIATGDDRGVRKLAAARHQADRPQRPPRPAGPDRRPPPRHARGLPLLDAGGPARPRHRARDGARRCTARRRTSCPTARGSGRPPAAGTSASSTTRRIFTYDELNAAAPNNPLWITGSGFRGARVNQAALDRARALGRPRRASSSGPTAGRPAGSPAPATALAINASILAQLDQLGIEGEAECLQDFIAEANSRGMTAWKDAGGNTAPWSTIGAINEGLHVEEGAMHALPRAWPQCAHRVQRDERLRAAGRASSEDMRNDVRLPRRRHVPLPRARRGHDGRTTPTTRRSRATRPPSG